MDIRVDIREKIDEVTDEKVLSYNTANGEYYIISFKHDKARLIFYNKYYLGASLSKRLLLRITECIQGVTWILSKLERVDELHSILSLYIKKRSSI